VQPGSGDSLQFMKAGIVEIPDITVVTKGDMEAAASQTRSDIKGAIKIAGATPASAAEGWETAILSVSALRGRGIADLVAALDAHRAFLEAAGRLARRRHQQAESWLVAAVRERFGREGLQRAGKLALAPGESPFRRLAEVARAIAG